MICLYFGSENLSFILSNVLFYPIAYNKIFELESEIQIINEDLENQESRLEAVSSVFELLKAESLNALEDISEKLKAIDNTDDLRNWISDKKEEIDCKNIDEEN